MFRRALATRYQPGRPVPVVLRFAKYAQKLGVVIANVGNRKTDFVGRSYQRGFKLPTYGKALS